MRALKYIIFILLVILMSQVGYSVKKCTVDLSIIGINNYEWVEVDYPVSNDEEIAYAICKKVAELAGDKFCNSAACVKYMMDWNPGTGAYGMVIHASSIGHSHAGGETCDGGVDNFIFGYNYDNHQRGSHCSYPTAPGKIDWYYAGSYRNCHENGAGSFSCEDTDPFCGDNTCGENENCYNCEEDCECGSQVCCDGECQNPVCSSNSNCNDGNDLTIDACNQPNTCNSYCSNVPCGVECHANSDCNDNNPLTTDTCNNPNTCNSDCVNIPCSIECNINSDCNDNNPGTIDTCDLKGTCEAFCTYENCADCFSDNDCNDNNGLTIDKCNNPGTCSSTCSNTPCDVACIYNSNCEDNNPLTTDTCNNPNTCNSDCVNVPCPIECNINSDCNDNNPGTTNTCNLKGTCEAFCTYENCADCFSDNDCNDNNGLTINKCNNPGTCGASCSNTPCDATCTHNSDCNDNNQATTDICNNPGTCGASCSNLLCNVACKNNLDCNDNKPLTTNTCTNAGTCSAKCTYTPCSIECHSVMDCDDSNIYTTNKCSNPSTCESNCVYILRSNYLYTYNGVCDTPVGENCETAPSDCKCGSNEICDTSRERNDGCYKIRCGDGYKDKGEEPDNCCSDFGCYDGKLCDGHSNLCVECLTDSSCNWGRCDTLLHKCVECIDNKDCLSGECKTSTHKCVECVTDNQCESREIWELEFSCSPDYKEVNQLGKRVNGKCDKTKNTCIGEKTPISRIIKDCTEDKTFCQDGTCGCSEDYEICEPIKRCVKKKSIKSNQLCKCDFQCEEGFCDETLNQCVKGLNSKISISNSALEIGEETTISLSVSNPLNVDVNADITLSLGDGVEIVEVLSGDQCSGSQCKLDKTIIPAGGKKDVTVRVKANSDTTSLMNAFVTYQVGSKKIEQKLVETSIEITECGNGIPEEGETSENCCIDVGCPPQDEFLHYYECDKEGIECDRKLNYSVLSILFIIVVIVSVLWIKSRNKKEKYKRRKRIK